MNKIEAMLRLVAQTSVPIDDAEKDDLLHHMSAMYKVRYHTAVVAVASMVPVCMWKVNDTGTMCTGNRQYVPASGTISSTLPHWLVPSVPSDCTGTINSGQRHYRGTTSVLQGTIVNRTKDC